MVFLRWTFKAGYFALGSCEGQTFSKPPMRSKFWCIIVIWFSLVLSNILNKNRLKFLHWIICVFFIVKAIVKLNINVSSKAKKSPFLNSETGCMIEFEQLSFFNTGNGFWLGGTSSRWSKIITVDLGQNSTHYPQNIKDNLFAPFRDISRPEDQNKK